MQNLLKLRKNKTFRYAPRYYPGEGQPFKIVHQLDKFRGTVHTTKGLTNTFSSALADLKMAGDKHLKLRFIIITAVLVVLFLFGIDFDLSLFL